MYDWHGDRLLDIDEYTNAVRDSGLPLTDEEIGVTFKQFDADADNELNLDEVQTAIYALGEEDNKNQSGPDNWDMYMELTNDCAMNQKMLRGGECETCKRPYVQSQDGRNCEYVAMRRYDSDSYMGRLLNYKQYGKGYYSWGESGNTYFGTWMEGMKHGWGINEWSSGAHYMGEFEFDEMHGYGRYTFASGKQYEGDMVYNYFTGHGTFSWPDGTTITGQFLDDEAHGWAVKEWPNGERYEGEWSMGWENGYGTRWYADGSVHEGNWAYGERDGWGSTTDAWGSVTEGTWDYGDYLGN